MNSNHILEMKLKGSSDSSQPCVGFNLTAQSSSQAWFHPMLQMLPELTFNNNMPLINSFQQYPHSTSFNLNSLGRPVPATMAPEGKHSHGVPNSHLRSRHPFCTTEGYMHPLFWQQMTTGCVVDIGKFHIPGIPACVLCNILMLPGPGHKSIFTDMGSHLLGKRAGCHLHPPMLDSPHLLFTSACEGQCACASLPPPFYLPEPHSHPLMLQAADVLEW